MRIGDVPDTGHQKHQTCDGRGVIHVGGGHWDHLWERKNDDDEAGPADGKTRNDLGHSRRKSEWSGLEGDLRVVRENQAATVLKSA